VLDVALVVAPSEPLTSELEMWTFGLGVTDDAAVMTGGHASFVGMLFDSLCKFKVSILTNNTALTFYMSPMRKDIFR
jgi:hypothetical protein